MVSPSRCLVLKGIADFASCCKNEQFANLYSDMWDECSNYGPVIQIKIPRPIFVDRTAENAKIDAQKLAQEELIEDRKAVADPRYIKTSERKKAKLHKDLEELDIYGDIRNYDFPQGFGNVYVKFLTVESCMKAVKHLNNIIYGEKIT